MQSAAQPLSATPAVPSRMRSSNSPASRSDDQGQFEPLVEIGDSLGQGHALQRQFSGGLPQWNGGFGKARCGEVMGQHLGFGCPDVREALLDHAVYGFVRQSGGQVRIYSKPGSGTIVCLYLPRNLSDEDLMEAPAAMVATPHAGQGETVLVVDDEPTVRMLVTEILEELGYIAIEATDGAAGLRVLQSPARVDLLITYIGLTGGMNGQQLVEVDGAGVSHSGGRSGITRGFRVILKPRARPHVMVHKWIGNAATGSAPPGAGCGRGSRDRRGRAAAEPGVIDRRMRIGARRTCSASACCSTAGRNLRRTVGGCT
jgi:CheY-like chemotaxis protein